jgi:hypothetical protein
VSEDFSQAWNADVRGRCCGEKSGGEEKWTSEWIGDMAGVQVGRGEDERSRRGQGADALMIWRSF